MGNFVWWLKCLFRDCETEDRELDHEIAERERIAKKKREDE